MFKHVKDCLNIGEENCVNDHDAVFFEISGSNFNNVCKISAAAADKYPVRSGQLLKTLRKHCADDFHIFHAKAFLIHFNLFYPIGFLFNREDSPLFYKQGSFYGNRATPRAEVP